MSEKNVRYVHIYTSKTINADGIYINNHEQLMKSYYGYDQDKMTPDSIRWLKWKMFPYLYEDDIRLNMSDRNIIHKEFDLTTDSILTENDKPSIGDFFLLYERLSVYT